LATPESARQGFSRRPDHAREPRNSGQTHRFDEVIQRKVPIAGMDNEQAAQSEDWSRWTSMIIEYQ
jgi:hypothetical protein